MIDRQPTTSTILYSLALTCLPLAFQIATGMPAGVPEGMRLLLVLSIWASLSFGILMLGMLVHAACVLYGRLRGAAPYRAPVSRTW